MKKEYKELTLKVLHGQFKKVTFTDLFMSAQL